MLTAALWLVGAIVALVVIDRVLLWCESRGWIHYRRNRLGRGGALYHTLELHSIFDPGMREVMEVKYGEEQEEDESGAPPGPAEEPDVVDDREGRPT